MSNKIYLVNYYVDYETRGIDAIFKNKEDALKYIEYAEELESDGFFSYNISEEILYDSYLDLLEEME